MPLFKETSQRIIKRGTPKESISRDSHSYLWLHRSYFDTIRESCDLGLLWLDIVRQCRWEFDSFKWEVQGRHRPGPSSGQPAKQTTQRRPRRLCRCGGGSGNFTQSWKPGQSSIACPALKSPNSKSEHIKVKFHRTKSIVYILRVSYNFQTESLHHQNWH